MEQAREEWVHSFCDMCTCGCGIRVLKINGAPVKVEGDPDHPQNNGKLCAKGLSGLMKFYDPWRIKRPLIRREKEKGIGVDPKWEEISWNDALDIVVERMAKIRREDPRGLIVSTWDEVLDKALLKFWLPAFGTPNWQVGASGHFCGNAVHPVNYLTTGTWYVDPDLEYCNYYLMIGSQLGFMVGYNTMPITGAMAQARKRGMKLVVVDPVCTPAASKADEWIPIHPGTDGMFALGLLNILLNDLKVFDEHFIRFFTNGPYLINGSGTYLRDKDSGKPLVWDSKDNCPRPFDDPEIGEPSISGSYHVGDLVCSPSFELLRNHLLKYPLKRVSEITSVPEKTLHRIAKEYGESSGIPDNKIEIEGRMYPLRPVAAYYDKGTSGHMHSFHSGWSIMLLNIVMGNLDTPGGIVTPNGAGPWWSPSMTKDGLLVPSEISVPSEVARSETFVYSNKPYPARMPKKPNSLDLFELFPVAVYSQTPMYLVAPEPDKFGLTYRPAMMLHWKNNFFHTTGDVDVILKFIRSIPFIVSFATQMEESVMMADIVLPQVSYLERLSYPKNTNFYRNRVDLSSYFWMFMQPVAKPAYESREVALVLLELAERLGFLGDFYSNFNSCLKDQYKLDTKMKYSWDEIVDRWLKSWAGENKGLEYAKAHGFIDFGRRRAEHAYWRRLHKIRAPVYLEFMQRVGDDVEKVTSDLGVRWDVSDYQPLPDWKPCPAYNENREDFDLFAVNFKSEHLMVSHTDNISWLSSIASKSHFGYGLLVNTETAKKKDLADGSKVRLRSLNGKYVEGTVKHVEGVHPKVIGVMGAAGHWAKGMPVAQHKGSHFNSLIQYDIDHIDPIVASLDSCVRVRVEKLS